MKSLVKKVGKFFWRSTGIIRRPISRKLEGRSRAILVSELDRFRMHLTHSMIETMQTLHNDSIHRVDVRLQEFEYQLENIVLELVHLQQQLEMQQLQREAEVEAKKGEAADEAASVSYSIIPTRQAG
jgi:hypothetical protein